MESIRELVETITINKFDRMADEVIRNKASFAFLMDEEISNLYTGFKATAVKQKDLLEALACIGEACVRFTGLEPRKQQYIAALMMYSGYAIDMKTGDGKTLCSIMAALLFALKTRAYLVTCNSYLAERDFTNYKSLFEFLKVSASVNMSGISKQSVYNSEVVFTSSSEFVFDYLQNEFDYSEKRINIKLTTAILDEMDFVLLDNANSSFSVCMGLGAAPDIALFSASAAFCKCLKGIELDNRSFGSNEPKEAKDYDYCYNYSRKAVFFTEEGLRKFYDFFSTCRKSSIHRAYAAVIYTIEAGIFYKIGRDYLVRDNKIILVNTVNGRLQPDSQFENELHTAIEIKEGLEPSNKTVYANTISYQSFFSKFKTLTGMSGTLYEACEEIEKCFEISVLKVPLSNTNLRKGYGTYVFETKRDKFAYVSEIIKKAELSRTFLVIAGSDYEAVDISQYLEGQGLVLTTMNNYTEFDEAETIKLAGTYGNITITTNMMGRGTDIIIDEMAKHSGGLTAIVLSRYESHRIDMQAAGRAGRNGDKGACIFVVSLEDEIFKIMDSNNFKIIKTEVKNKHKSKCIEEIIGQTQRNADIQSFYSRSNNFSLDLIIEACKEKLISHIQGIQALEDIKEFVEFEKFNYFQTRNIVDKAGAIGEKNALLLVKLLTKNIFISHWLEFRKNMNSLKFYVQFYKLERQQMLAEFTKICFKELEKLEENALVEVLEYLMCAQISGQKVV